MPLPNCFNATREIPSTEMPRVTGKMRRSKAKQMMLFDLDKDPYETNDVTEEHPEIVNLLLEKLADYYVSQIFQISRSFTRSDWRRLPSEIRDI